jgi:DNA-directed RNA polymerase subunit RPC12/RpoP
MRGPAGRCPNCSAPLRFRWSSAIQTTCEACRSVIVRHDVDLETIGEIADLPPDSSPIQIGTEGSLDGRGFTVVGRIVYEYEDGGWSEWHLVYSDGTSGWLSDAQLEFAVSSLVEPPQPLPKADTVRLGLGYTWDNRELEVATLTTARYKGVEGELPFEYWGKEDVLFADLRGHDATFGTIDYSDGAPILFIGRFVAFDELRLRNLREFEAVDGSRAMQGFNCGNCGAAVELRALAHTRAVACTSCGAVIDARDRNVTILQEAAARQSITPLIPLGTRGTWHGQPYDVIGFQQRSIEVEGVRYAWDEYVLFNPCQGFRYLTYYNGHWNDVATVRERPALVGGGSRPSMRHGSEAFKAFQHAVARTDFVLGEFPWRVHVGETVKTDDYIAPPLMLSSEGTDQERTWSIGRYTPPDAIWKAFALPDAPPEPVGVFANQPNPRAGRVWPMVLTFLALAGVLVLMAVIRLVTADRERVLTQQSTFTPTVAEAAFVTAPFTLSEASTVEIGLGATVDNSWLGFDLALVNLETGDAFNVEEEVSYYHGVEGGESWTEGSTTSSKLLRAVPAGQYYLRVEPEGPVNGPAVPFTIRVRRDVPSLLPYALGLILLSIPVLFSVIRYASFEARRMQESDYGSSGGDSDDDDDE